MAVTMARITISLELNQSRSLPWSSITCSAPTQTIKSASPTMSIGSLRVGVSRLFRFIQVAPVTSRPTGTLIRNIQPQ